MQALPCRASYETESGMLFIGAEEHAALSVKRLLGVDHMYLASPYITLANGSEVCITLFLPPNTSQFSFPKSTGSPCVQLSTAHLPLMVGCQPTICHSVQAAQMHRSKPSRHETPVSRLDLLSTPVSNYLPDPQ
jgi:hypothetical protein